MYELYFTSERTPSKVPMQRAGAVSRADIIFQQSVLGENGSNSDDLRYERRLSYCREMNCCAFFSLGDAMFALQDRETTSLPVGDGDWLSEGLPTCLRICPSDGVPSLSRAKGAITARPMGVDETERSKGSLSSAAVSA